MLNRSPVLTSSLIVLSVAGFCAAQAPTAQEATKPDSPEARQLLETAKKSADTDWIEAYDFICAFNPGRANRPDDPEIEPTRVFDNLHVIGRTSTVVWVVTTSNGIVLIDSGTGISSSRCCCPA